MGLGVCMCVLIVLLAYCGAALVDVMFRFLF